MGLLDKFKNLFTDEELIEEEKEIEEPKKQEPKLPQVMMDSIEKTELNKEVIKDKEIVSDRTLVQTKTKFNFPVEFTDEDFKATRSSKNIVTKVREQEIENTKKIYSKNQEEAKPQKFRCTPIISPVYGILDKNYKKEEVIEKDERIYDLHRPSQKLDFDSVRKKAFGDLTEDIKENLLCEDCELLKESKAKLASYRKDGLLNDIMVDKKEEVKEEENYYDFGVSYTKSETITEIKPVKVETIKEEKKQFDNILDDDFPNNEEIPPLVEENTYNDLEIVNYNNMDPVAEKIETKELPKRSEKNKLDDLELTDDLFNLIDSMYAEADKKE